MSKKKLSELLVWIFLLNGLPNVLRTRILNSNNWFRICLLKSTANSAQVWWKWARLAVLFSRQILSRSLEFKILVVRVLDKLSKQETPNQKLTGFFGSFMSHRNRVYSCFSSACHQLFTQVLNHLEYFLWYSISSAMFTFIFQIISETRNQKFCEGLKYCQPLSRRSQCVSISFDTKKEEELCSGNHSLLLQHSIYVYLGQ